MTRLFEDCPYTSTRHHSDASASESFGHGSLADAIAHAKVLATYTGVSYTEVHTQGGVFIWDCTGCHPHPAKGELAECGA